MQVQLDKRRQWSWALVRVTLGFLQMMGAVASLLLLVETGVNTVSLASVIVTGLFTTLSAPEDIAQHVLDRLEQAEDEEKVPGPDIVYLDKLILRINPVMAQRLNLEIPESYRKYVHAP